MELFGAFGCLFFRIYYYLFWGYYFAGLGDFIISRMKLHTL